MSKVSYGLDKVEVAAIDGVTGLPDTWEDVGKIYRETITLETADGEKTEHFSELDQNPILVIQEQGAMTLNMSLMDTSPANLVKYLGGTVTGVDPNEVWNKPNDIVDIEFAWRITFKDGTKTTFNRGKTTGKYGGDFNRKGIQLLQLMISPLQPKVDGVPVMTVGNPV